MKASVEQVSEVIRRIHEAGAAPEKWEEALAAIVALFEGSRGSILDIEVGSDQLVGLTHIGHDPAHAKLYAEYYYRVDPTRAVALSMPPLVALTGYEQFPRSVRNNHEYFDYAERICNIGDVLGVSTVPHGRRAVLSLQRTTRAPEYGQSEKKMAELLAPHLQLAKRVETTLGVAWSAKAELEAAFSHIALPALIVDADGRIRHANAAATTLFARHKQLDTRHGRLVFGNATVDCAYRNAVVAAACGGGRSAAIPVQLGPKTRAEVLISPLDAEHGVAQSWQIPLALVVVDTGERDDEAIAARIKQLYGLTTTESRIAAALAAGRTVEEIRKAKHVSDATLRTHLQSIYRKTGVRRQADVVRLALRTSFVARGSSEK
jgi:DNA-binding CsgD family transcriptional regulator